MQTEKSPFLDFVVCGLVIILHRRHSIIDMEHPVALAIRLYSVTVPRMAAIKKRQYQNCQLA